MKFVADCMLGKLAKWLKILGFDVLYFRRIEDEELVALAAKEGRTLLTRDTRLVHKTKRLQHLSIISNRWEEQVVQVLAVFRLWDKIQPHSRCLDCNQLLKPLSREEARNLATPFVLEKSNSLAICPACGRVFWKGTHYSDMEAKISEILGKRASAEQ